MKIEEYIRKNRSMMDIDQPDEDLIWIGVSQSLENHAKQRRAHHWRYALLAAAMVVIAFAAGYHVTKKSEHHHYYVNIDPEFARQKTEFVNLIGHYTRQIEQVDIDLETLATTPADLEFTDRLIELYSADLRQFGASPELINTLLELYGQKIFLLNRMLNEIKLINEHESNKFFQ